MRLGLSLLRRLAPVLLLPPTAATAYDGFTSEISHAAGGALMAGLVVQACADDERRAWIGFAVSAAAGALSESLQASRGARGYSSMLDAASHAAGAAVGAWAGDRYRLLPVLQRPYVGFLLVHRF
jgi:hypothetical protein